MPKTIESTVENLNDKLRKSGQPLMTIRWSDFYELGEVERFKQARLEGLQKHAKDEFGLIIGYGHTVVVVAHDRNFAPA